MEELTTKLRNCELARESLTEANAHMHELAQKREVAVNALVDYAIAAYVAEESIEGIMAACGFEPAPEDERPRHPRNIYELLGLEQASGTPVEQFAAWLGKCLAERIVERSEEQG